MKILITFLSLAGLGLTGCAQNQPTARRADRRRDDVVYTGSNIPQPRNRLTASPVSATTPVGSYSRSPDSLVPTEPVVGATDNTRGQGDTGPTPQNH